MHEYEFSTWLLSAQTPSIQYQALLDLCDYPTTDTRVIKAQQAIMKKGPVPAILGHQTKSGQWHGERSYYTPKYVSTHWSMMLLTELSIDGGNAHYRQGVRYMAEATADELDERLDTNALGLGCFWGNLLRYTLHAGKVDEDQVEKLIDYLTRDLQNGFCRCPHNQGYACAWGVVRALWGLAAISQGQRPRNTDRAITQGVKFLLESYRLVEANYPAPGQGGSNPLWFKLNFPLFYQVDLLFALRVLDELGQLDHPGVQTTLDWLAQRRGRNGRWIGSSPFRQRTWRELGDRDETNRWVSLYASRILRHAGRLPVFEIMA